MMNKSQILVIASLLFISGQAQADSSSSAYGAQAQMSPATTSSTLSIGNNGGANNPGNGGYIPGNGVYLTGQAAIVNPTPPPQMTGVPQGMPIAPTQQGMLMQGGQYYGNQQMPSQSYGSPYANYGAYPGAQQMGYGNVPGGYPSQDPAGTYSTSKPAYGMPPQMVQRNSSTYYNNTLPYRNNPGVTLNPNSYTNPQQASGPKYNEQALGILNFNEQQKQNSNSNVKPASNRQSNGGNWISKVLQRGK